MSVFVSQPILYINIYTSLCLNRGFGQTITDIVLGNLRISKR